MSAPQLCVVGEALIDVEYAAGSSTGLARPGGSPLNVAVGLARLEQRVSFVGRFSRDPFGGVLRRHAEANGVDLSAAAATPQPSTIALVSLDAEGVAEYEFSVAGTADFGWTAEELALPAAARLVHFGSLASWLPPGSDAIAAAVAVARERGVLVSYDPNVRPSLQPEPEYAQRQVEDGVRLAHVVKASEDDVSYLYPDDDPGRVAQRWLALGAALVVVTHGGRGCTAWSATGVEHRAAPSIDLVDTVGAGDAFTAGLLDGLVCVGADSADGLAGAPDLAAVLDHACLVAAMTCERPGADPPRRAEVERRAASASR